MYFTNTAYRLRLLTNLNLSVATSLVINYTSPYYAGGSWTATADGKTAYVDISDSEIARPGTYKLQLVAVIDGQTKRASIAIVNFEKPL